MQLSSIGASVLRITILFILSFIYTMSLPSTAFADNAKLYRIDEQCNTTEIGWELLKSVDTDEKIKFIIDGQTSYNEIEYTQEIKDRMQDILGKVCRLSSSDYTLHYGYSSKIQMDGLKQNEKVILVWLQPAVGTEELDTKAKVVAVDIANKARQYSSNPREQLRYINDYLVYNVEYDVYSSENVEKADGAAWSAYGALIKGKAVCAGYSNAVTMICEYLGIPVIEVYGDDHEWNVVYIDGEWLHLDTTWNDPQLDGKPTNHDIEREKEVFFLKTIDQFYTLGHERTEDNVEELVNIKYPELQYMSVEEWDGAVLEALNTPDKLLTNSALVEIIARTEGMMLLERNRDKYERLALEHFDNIAEYDRVYVGYLIDRGIISGSDDRNFGGNVNITLEELNIALDRMKGQKKSIIRTKNNIYNKQIATYSDLLKGIYIPDKQVKFIGEGLH